MGLWHLNEATSGAVPTTAGVILDASGANSGTFSNVNASVSPTTAYTTGKLNGAITFDGTDDYVDMGDPTSVDFGAGDFTLEAWVKLNSLTAAGHEFVIGKDNNTAGRQFNLMLDGGGDNTHIARIVYFTSNTTYVFGDTAANAINDTNWHHVAAGRSGNSFLVIDGVAQ